MPDVELQSVIRPSPDTFSQQDGSEKTPETEQWPELLPESWKIPDVMKRWDTRQYDFTEEEREKAWDETAKIVKDYNDELVKHWKENIDDLPVYAGLFSAALTALIVESYKLLSPPPPDPILVALQQISVQLSSFSVTPPFVNSTQPIVSQALSPAPPAPRWAVWLNVLWFSSLIFSLSAASVGIMVKQWLNEHMAGLNGDSHHFARLRQLRLQNLERWHVAGIVTILPVLLQIALVLFFGGLLVWLWNINPDVATVASALVGLLLVFTIGSSMIPIFRADCCFLSPPVYALYNLMRPARATAFHLRRLMWNALCRIRRLLKYSDDGSDVSDTWVEENWKFKPWKSTWRGREMYQISNSSYDLDAAMVTKAYTITIDQSYLTTYATICCSGLDLPQFADCYRGLMHEMDRYQEDKADIPLTLQSDLWLAKKLAPFRVDILHGLPDMHQFWEDMYDWRRCPTGASSHWREQLWANALIKGNTSVAYERLVLSLHVDDYQHHSNEIRQRVLRVIEQELRENVQKSEDNSLQRCSLGLLVLLRWVGASSSMKDAQPEETEPAKVIRALARHGLLCHFKCYISKTGKTLSLHHNNTDILIWRLRELCEDHAPDFMNPQLVDALVLVYQLHQEEFQQARRHWDPAEEDKNWILKLQRERTSAHAHIRDKNRRPADTQTPLLSVDSERAAAAIPQESEASSHPPDVHAPSERDHRAEQQEPEPLNINPPLASSSSG